MNCPNCNEVLVMADRQGIEVDYCPKCRGVWLDRGELDKIIDRSSEYTQPAPQRGHSDSRHEGHSTHHYKRKKDSFLGDLFDF